MQLSLNDYVNVAKKVPDVYTEPVVDNQMQNIDDYSNQNVFVESAQKVDLCNKDKDKDLFIGPQEFVVGYSKAPEQPQSSARPICHSHTMTRTGCEPATIRIAA